MDGRATVFFQVYTKHQHESLVKGYLLQICNQCERILVFYWLTTLRLMSSEVGFDLDKVFAMKVTTSKSKRSSFLSSVLSPSVNWLISHLL